MNSPANQPKQRFQSSCDEHPFGGCNRLLGHYKTIGDELLQIEVDGSIGSLREGVAFIPVEVLESYLEDLLDLGVKEETLYIKRDQYWLRSWQVLASGVGLALCSGLYAASAGSSIPTSFGVILMLGLPFGLIFYFSPKAGLMRRMYFAQVLSAEISRRRGRDKDGNLPTSRLIFKEVLAPSKPTPLQGAAKTLFH